VLQNDRSVHRTVPTFACREAVSRSPLVSLASNQHHLFHITIVSCSFGGYGNSAGRNMFPAQRMIILGLMVAWRSPFFTVSSGESCVDLVETSLPSIWHGGF
jgi:hypothetical protein